MGWTPLLRDLRLGLGPSRAASVERALEKFGLRHALALRDNLVAYKKVPLDGTHWHARACLGHAPPWRPFAHTGWDPWSRSAHRPTRCCSPQVLLGIYRSHVALAHDLKQLATFFREPPATFAKQAEESRAGSPAGDTEHDATTAVANSAETAAHVDHGAHRAFFRPSRYRELSDALCSIEGGIGAVLDGRRFLKAVCCVPRHPDAAPRQAQEAPSDRSHGQPCSHYRCAGLLAEPLPAALKCWRLLQEVSVALGARDGASSPGGAHGVEESTGPDHPTGAHHPPGVGERLREVLASGTAAIHAISEPEVRSRWGSLLDLVASLDDPSPHTPPAERLAAEELWFVRCVLIARGGAKALHVAAEAQRLVSVMRVVLRVCAECDQLLRAEGSTEAPRASWASMLQCRADAEAEAASNGAARTGTAASSGASLVGARIATHSTGARLPAEGSGGGRLGHPSIRRWVLARKHGFTLGGLRASAAETLRWLVTIAEENEDGRVLFLGADAKPSARLGTTAFAPCDFALARFAERPRSIVERHSVWHGRAQASVQHGGGPTNACSHPSG